MAAPIPAVILGFSGMLAITVGQTLPVLPGEFAFRTFGGYYLTAADGGDRITEVVHTDVQQAWEKFRQLFDLGSIPPTQYTFRTANGHFVSAVGGQEALHTSATQIGPWEKFRIYICGRKEAS
jgi:hypothetical protein